LGAVGRKGSRKGTRASRRGFMKESGRMKRTIWSSRVVRTTALFLFLVASAVPGAALAAGMGGSMGGGGFPGRGRRGGAGGGGARGGGGFRGSGSSGGGGGGGVGGNVRSGGSWSGGGSWNRGGSWNGSNGWHGGWWGGPRFFVGVGAPFWWYPYGYAYTYPV